MDIPADGFRAWACCAKAGPVQERLFFLKVSPFAAAQAN
jgi:hypothetical protein